MERELNYLLFASDIIKYASYSMGPIFIKFLNLYNSGFCSLFKISIAGAFVLTTFSIITCNKFIKSLFLFNQNLLGAVCNIWELVDNWSFEPVPQAFKFSIFDSRPYTYTVKDNNCNSYSTNIEVKKNVTDMELPSSAASQSSLDSTYNFNSTSIALSVPV